MYIDESERDQSTKNVFTIGDDLAKFSVEELETLIIDLKNEKERVEIELNRKKNSMSQADSVFSSLK